MSNDRPTNSEQLRPSAVAPPTTPASGIPRAPALPQIPENPSGEFLQSVVDNAAERAARRTADFFNQDSKLHRLKMENYMQEHRREALARVRADEARERRFDLFCDEVRGDLASIKRRLEDGDKRFDKNEGAARVDRERSGRVLESVSALRLLVSRSELVGTDPLKDASVLVVEDEPEVQHAMARVLGDAGASVLFAETLEGARSVFSEHRVDAVVVDIQLRGGDDGMRLVRELRLGHGEVGVVIASGNVDSEVIAEARELDVTAVLHKPYSALALVSALVEVLDAGRGTNS